jgi:hypothetical protein
MIKCSGLCVQDSTSTGFTLLEFSITNDRVVYCIQYVHTALTCFVRDLADISKNGRPGFMSGQASFLSHQSTPCSFEHISRISSHPTVFFFLTINQRTVLSVTTNQRNEQVANRPNLLVTNNVACGPGFSFGIWHETRGSTYETKCDIYILLNNEMKLIMFHYI